MDGWRRCQLWVPPAFQCIGLAYFEWSFGGVSAQRPAPVSTQAWIVIRVSGRPPAACPPDWWLLQPQGDLLLRRLEPPDFELVLPLTEAERSTLIWRMRRSRPGPSGFKLLFLSLFPPRAQMLVWRLLDVQRLAACIAPSLRRAIQVHAQTVWRVSSPVHAGGGLQSA